MQYLKVVATLTLCFCIHTAAHGWFGVFKRMGSAIRSNISRTYKKKNESIKTMFKRSMARCDELKDRSAYILDGWEFVPRVEEKIPVIDRVSPFSDVIKRVKTIDVHDRKAGKSLERMAQEIDATLEKVEDERQLLFQLANRGSEDFVQELGERYRNNFERLGMQADQAYELLGFDQAHARSIELKQLKKAIAQLDDEFCKRQMDYLFRNEYAKQEFDAFLAGEGEMEQLQIDLDTAEQFKQMSEEIGMAKCWLGECKRVIRAKLNTIRP